MDVFRSVVVAIYRNIARADRREIFTVNFATVQIPKSTFWTHGNNIFARLKLTMYRTLIVMSVVLVSSTAFTVLGLRLCKLCDKGMIQGLKSYLGTIWSNGTLQLCRFGSTFTFLAFVRVIGDIRRVFSIGI